MEILFGLSVRRRNSHQPLVEERPEDGCLHVELEELRKNELRMTDDKRANNCASRGLQFQSLLLHEIVEVSEIDFLEDFA